MPIMIIVLLVGIALYFVFKNTTQEKNKKQKDFEEIYEETINKKDKTNDTTFDSKG